MVTYPKIEALWVPKHQRNSNNNTKKNKDHSHSTEVKSNIINDNHNSTTTTNTNDDHKIVMNQTGAVHDEGGDHHLHHHQKQQQQQQHHHRTLHLPRIRNLLAALNFEHHHHHDHPNDDAVTAELQNKQHAQSNNAEKETFHTPASNNQDGIVSGHASRSQSKYNNKLVLRGSIEGSTADIFYDALQYGDSPYDSNDFLPDIQSPPRESVVLSNVITTATSYRSPSNHQYSNNTIETVLQSNNNSNYVHDHHDDNDGNDNRNKSIEYTEQEFNVNRSTTTMDSGNTTIEVSDDVSSPRSGTTSSIIYPPQAPLPPTELPLRFLRAGKNDPNVGIQRYNATLQMRQTNHIDTILREPSPKFHIIKQYYPHYCHFRGKNNEPCFYEQPPKTNLSQLRKHGVTLDQLLRHYTMVTEHQWQYIERDDLAKSIYIIDLDGIRITDFAGEAVDFVKKASAFSAQHYPERAGYVFVINVPGWFKLIWNVVKPIIDEDTLKKIYILRGKEEIRNAMQERIDIEFIPPEYGGTSVPLGQSPQEKTLAEWMEHNNILAAQQRHTCSDHTNCKFCTWIPARSY